MPIDEGTEPDDSDSGDSEIIKFNEDDKSYLSILGHHRPAINLLKGHAEFSSHKLIVILKVIMQNMLSLCSLSPTPGKKFDDLKESSKTWQESFDNWKQSAEFTPEIKSLLTDMQLLHECKDSMDNHFKNRNKTSNSLISANMLMKAKTWRKMISQPQLTRGALHNLLQDMDGKVGKSSHEMDLNVVNILGCMQNTGLFNLLINSDSKRDGVEENITPIPQTHEEDWKEAYMKRKAAWRLRESLHSSDYDMNEMSKLLKMFLSGPVGTGKSHVFNALRAFFEAKNQARHFRVCSYMGI